MKKTIIIIFLYSSAYTQSSIELTPVSDNNSFILNINGLSKTNSNVGQISETFTTFPLKTIVKSEDVVDNVNTYSARTAILGISSKAVGSSNIGVLGKAFSGYSYPTGTVYNYGVLGIADGATQSYINYGVYGFAKGGSSSAVNGGNFTAMSDVNGTSNVIGISGLSVGTGLVGLRFGGVFASFGPASSVHAGIRARVNNSVGGNAYTIGGDFEARNDANTLTYGIYSMNYAENSSNKYGVYGGVITSGGADNIGVQGNAWGSGTGTLYGIYGSFNKFGTGTAYAGYFNGNVYCTGLYLPSDERLKNNIHIFYPIIEKIKLLNPVEYEYKISEYPNANFIEGQHYGFTAQNIKEVFPNLVKEGIISKKKLVSNKIEDNIIDEKETIMKVNYIELIPILTKAIQEQQQIIENLQSEIKNIKSKMKLD